MQGRRAILTSTSILSRSRCEIILVHIPLRQARNANSVIAFITSICSEEKLLDARGRLQVAGNWRHY